MHSELFWLQVFVVALYRKWLLLLTEQAYFGLDRPGICSGAQLSESRIRDASTFHSMY